MGFKFNALTGKFDLVNDGGSGSTTFTGLTDTPANYTGQSEKLVRVNTGETALEFVSASGSTYTVVTTAIDRTMQSTDNCIICNTASNTIDITLPSSEVASGRMITIKDNGNAQVYNITVVTEAAETIDGAATYTIDTNYSFVTFVCDGTNWHIIG